MPLPRVGVLNLHSWSYRRDKNKNITPPYLLHYSPNSAVIQRGPLLSQSLVQKKKEEREGHTTWCDPYSAYDIAKITAVGCDTRYRARQWVLADMRCLYFSWYFFLWVFSAPPFNLEFIYFWVLLRVLSLGLFCVALLSARTFSGTGARCHVPIRLK
jgi:hypothetical protein